MIVSLGSKPIFSITAKCVSISFRGGSLVLSLDCSDVSSSKVYTSSGPSSGSTWLSVSSSGFGSEGMSSSSSVEVSAVGTMLDITGAEVGVDAKVAELTVGLRAS